MYLIQNVSTTNSDKDVCLMRERFNLEHIDYEHMSPVIIPRGYTKKYIEGEITHKDQLDKVMDSYHHVGKVSDITLMEGENFGKLFTEMKQEIRC